MCDFGGLVMRFGLFLRGQRGQGQRGLLILGQLCRQTITNNVIKLGKVRILRCSTEENHFM